MQKPLFALVLQCTLAVALASLLGMPSAHALEMRGLYRARVAVASKAPAVREAALGELLEAVVVKVSGQRQPASNSEVVQAIASPDSYVQQYGYESGPGGTTATAGAQPQGQAQPPLFLWARFDPNAVNQLLTRAGLPIWGRVRPTVLVWLAVQRDEQRQLIGADDGSGLGDLMREAAAARGVPLVLPLLDLEDRSHVSVGDVWGGFRDSLLAASKRYEARAILIAKAYQKTPGNWVADWQLQLEDQPATWTTQGDRLDAVLAAGIEQMADNVAARFAQIGGSGSGAGIEFTVNGVKTLADFARALHYLQSLDSVSKVEVIRLQGDSVTFHAQAQGGLGAFKRIIALSRTLATASPEPEPVTGGSAASASFQLLP